MFVTFEGPEGAGKSTALKTVAAKLAEQGIRVECTREPGAGRLGHAIREMLLHSDPISSQTELLLFLADRSNHVTTTIAPALQDGTLVLCDRYSDSTLVYQGYARGLDAEFIRTANEFATGGLTPDLTLLFDLPAEVGLSRLVSKDRLDAEPLEFHANIRQGFLTLAREEPHRWRLIDAAQDPSSVANRAFALIMDRLSKGCD